MVLTKEEIRERNRIAEKKYRESEKGKIKRRIAEKKYRESEKGKKYQKTYQKLSREKNKERNKILHKEYQKTEIGKKSLTKSNWKKRGLNMENFEEIYERYTNAIFCDICECVLEGNGRNKKCMDHDHDSGDFRNIVCMYCNIHICK